MKNLVAIGSERLKGVLIQDKKENPNKIIGVLRSEIISVLNSYMEVAESDFDFDIVVNAEGKFVVNFSAKANRLKVANYIF